MKKGLKIACVFGTEKEMEKLNELQVKHGLATNIQDAEFFVFDYDDDKKEIIKKWLREEDS